MVGARHSNWRNRHADFDKIKEGMGNPVYTSIHHQQTPRTQGIGPALGMGDKDACVMVTSAAGLVLSPSSALPNLSKVAIQASALIGRSIPVAVQSLV